LRRFENIFTLIGNKGVTIDPTHIDYIFKLADIRGRCLPAGHLFIDRPAFFQNGDAAGEIIRRFSVHFIAGAYFQSGQGIKDIKFVNTYLGKTV